MHFARNEHVDNAPLFIYPRNSFQAIKSVLYHKWVGYGNNYRSAHGGPNAFALYTHSKHVKNGEIPNAPWVERGFNLARADLRQIVF